MSPAASRTATIMCAAPVVDGQRDVIVEVVRAQAGRVLQSAADALVAAFDSASAAVTAAIDVQQHFATPAKPPALQVGLATGDVVWDDDGFAGAAMTTAEELVRAARPGQILVNNVVRWLVSLDDGSKYASTGMVDIDGFGEPVEVFAVEWMPLTDASEAASSRLVVPLPAALATPSRQPMAGRSAEWDVLAAAWLRVVDGAREVVLIGGEAGAGKTRLAAEFVRHCHHTGAVALLGTCDAELALPYQPWVHVLDHLLRSLPGFGRSLNSDRDLGDLLVLLPQLERLLPGLQRSKASDPETERYLLFSAVDRLLASTARQSPIVLLLDDIHWAGNQTLELLRHLVRNGVAARLLIIATYRDTGADLVDQLGDCLVDLQRSESVTRLRLDGLDVAGVEQFVAGALQQELDGDLRQLAAAVRDRSDGNAFFLGELWRHLLHHGVVVRRDDRWVVDRDVAVVGAPDTVKDVVHGRMARLSRRARRPLELAAAAGQRVEFRVLSLAAEITADEVAEGLDELVDAGFVIEVGGQTLTYQFTHALVRDTVEEVVSPSARTRHHLRIAEALAQVYGADPRSVYAELAHHFGAAAAVGGVEPAIHFGRLAAAQATGTGAYGEAISHYQAVLALLPDGSIEATGVLVDLGLAQMRHGQSFKAQDTHAQAFESARRGGWAEIAAHAALGYEEAVHQPGAPGAPAVKMVSEAIQLIGDQQHPLRTRLQASLTRSLFLAGDKEGARTAGSSALAMARAVGEPECIMAALQAISILLSDPEQLLATSTELGDVAQQVGDNWSGVYATANICRALIELGRLDEASAILEQHRMMSDRGRFLVFQYMGHVYEAVLELAAGRFVEAELAAERAHEVGESSNTVFDAGVYGLQMFAIRREEGRLSEVLPLMRVLASQSGSQTVWRPGLTVLYAELGMLTESLAELEALAPSGFASVPRDSVWPACLTFLAEACIACGASTYAPALLAELDAYAGYNVQVGMTICFGPADRLRGGLAHLLGLTDQADRHFRDALALAERSSSPVWRARVQHDWAKLAATRGDVERANSLAADAHATAVSLGMSALAEQTSRLLGRVPVAAPPVETYDGMTARELDVLRLIAEGRSNREIGEELFISQHTAANHVRSILQKTGCVNRAEAAAYAVHHRVVVNRQM